MFQTRNLLAGWICLLIGVTTGFSQSEENAIPESALQNSVDSSEIGYREAIILGVVEGITEYLPVSSTGHLLLTNAWLGLDSDSVILDEGGRAISVGEGEYLTVKRAADAYAIIIQSGAILAVAVVFWPRIWQLFLGVIGVNPHGRRLARNLILAFLPAAIIGLLLDSWIESLLFYPIPIAVALAFGGVLMLGVERWRKDQRMGQTMDTDLHMLGVRQCLLIGFLQCLAMWPGTSRSMITIVGGYLAGLSPRRSAEFSFLLGLVTLTAASGYRAVTIGPALLEGARLGPMLLGCFVAFVSAAIAVKWLIAYLTNHGLGVFAWYRFVLAGVVLFYFL